MSNMNDFLVFIKQVLLTTFNQLTWLLGLLFIFGFILYFFARLTRITYVKTTGKTLDIIVTGWIGTPVHELGHIIFCLIFRHKILEVSLYNPNPNDNTLGYVNHSYDAKSIYHRIGNFFIGIGPIIFGTLVLYILLYFLVPNAKDVLVSIKSQSAILLSNIHGEWSGFTSIWDTTTSTIKVLFEKSNFSSYKFWIFLYLSICISSHMELSPPDIKGAISGLLLIILLFLVINFIIIGLETIGANQSLGSFWKFIKIESYSPSINKFIGMSGALFFFAAIVSGINFFVTYLSLNLYNVIRGKGFINPIW
ncbi:MAG: hypothetical protein AB9846_16830 [Tenuifilaceae bacterium]